MIRVLHIKVQYTTRQNYDNVVWHSYYCHKCHNYKSVKVIKLNKASLNTRKAYKLKLLLYTMN